jgi:hypothetical protein
VRGLREKENRDMMRIGVGAVVLVGSLVTPGLAQLDPNDIPGWENDVIESITVTNMWGVFDPALGDDLGQFSITPKEGGPIVTINYEVAGAVTVPVGTDGVLYILMNLYRDESVGMEAKGHFNGDGVGDPDWELGWDDVPIPGEPNLTFLEGTLTYFQMAELPVDTGMLVGGGRILATGGLLYGMAGWPGGDEETSLTSFEFGVEDGGGVSINISDFGTYFQGDFFLNFFPDDEHGIPEPATLALLGSGLFLVTLRRRR